MKKINVITILSDEEVKEMIAEEDGSNITPLSDTKIGKEANTLFNLMKKMEKEKISKTDIANIMDIPITKIPHLTKKIRNFLDDSKSLKKEKIDGILFYSILESDN